MTRTRIVPGFLCACAMIGVAAQQGTAFADSRGNSSKSSHSPGDRGQGRMVHIGDRVIRPPGQVHRPDHPNHGRGALHKDGCIYLPPKPHSP